MFYPKGECLIYKMTNFPRLSISFSNLFHNTLNMIWTTPSLNCRYLLKCVHTSYQPYGHPPLTLCSWQWAHKNPWCNSWHLCCHYAGCWFPHGVRTTTCASFKHIQFLSSTNQHCVHQRWHFSWHYHCRPNTSDLLRQSCATQGFASLMQFKPKNKIITTDTPLINSSPEQWRYLDVYISKWMCSYTIVPMPFGV